MKSKTIVIFGSSRSNGNTMDAVKSIIQKRKIEVIDLNKVKITPYDYNHGNSNDDFIKIAKKMVNSDMIIFATPVYWYSMSSHMKIFFDRLTDIIQIRKDLVRSLKGKTCYLIVSGTDTGLPHGFEVPFRRTCNYFDMKYKDAFYYYVKKDRRMPEETKNAAKKFGEKFLER